MFVLVESIHTGNSPRSGLQGIRGAIGILQYLIKHGNKAAEKRLTDVEQICEHLNIALDNTIVPGTPAIQQEQPVPVFSSTSNETAPIASISGPEISFGSFTPRDITEGVLDLDWRQALILPQDSINLSNGLQLNDDAFLDNISFGDLNGFNFDFSGDFMLTGADETDWEAFERQIARYQ